MLDALESLRRPPPRHLPVEAFPSFKNLSESLNRHAFAVERVAENAPPNSFAFSFALSWILSHTRLLQSVSLFVKLTSRTTGDASRRDSFCHFAFPLYRRVEDDTP